MNFYFRNISSIIHSNNSGDLGCRAKDESNMKTYEQKAIKPFVAMGIKT